MKNIKIRKKTEQNRIDCVLCQANFEIWLNNQKINLEREEKLRERFLSFCPDCKRKSDK